MSLVSERSPFRPVPETSNAAFHAAFFMLCACVPWLNPVAGGAMTPAIPLLTGWMCISLLFLAFPSWRSSPSAVYAGAFIVVASLGGLVFDRAWQLLALGMLMIGAAAAVGARMAQDDAAVAAQGHKPALYAGVRLIAWAWLLAGLLNAGIGLLQYFQHTAWLGDLVNHAAAGQVYGNLRQRNQYATLMNIALWALWYLWQCGALQQLVGRWLGRHGGALLAWLLMLPLAVCMALTLSRTGLVQLAVLLVLLAWWDWRRPAGDKQEGQPSRPAVMLWLGGILVAYLAAGYVMPHLAGMTDILVRLEGKDSRACISRTVLWGNVLQLTAQKPWTGWGWGELDYAHYYANYPGTRFCDMLDNAHNLPLHLAVELGAPLALLFCAVVLVWLWRSRPWAEQSSARQLMWGVLAAIGVHSLLEYPLWYAPFQLACGLTLGALWATAARTRGQKTPAGRLPQAARAVEQGAATGVATEGATTGSPVVAPAERHWLKAQYAVAVLMLLGLFYASFDFVRVTQLYTAPEDRVWPFANNTVAQASRTPLYQNAVRFAGISTIPLTEQNAAEQLAQAQRLMHFSPEARVVERIIKALQLLGREAEAQQAIAHFRTVYPREFADWEREQH